MDFLTITHRHDTGISKQISNVLWCFKVVWFPNYCFVYIGRVPADPKFQIAKLILPLNKHKTDNPWGGLMYWLQISCFEHLVNFLLESFLQLNQDWSTECPLEGNTLIYLDMIWGTWKASNTLKTSGWLCKICSLLVTNLGTSCFASGTVTAWLVL